MDGLHLEQKLSQNLSPQTLQYLQVLQMNVQELREYIDAELLENPMLDSVIAAAAGRPAFSESYRVWAESRDFSPETIHENLPTLRDHLMSQLDFSALRPDLSRTIEFVIINLDNNGWLDEPVENLAEMCDVPCQTVLEAEAIIVSLDPPGIGARSLKQCLSRQLQKTEGLSDDVKDAAMLIIDSHLEDLAKQHLNKISTKTGYAAPLVHKAREVILSLNPRPGSSFAAPGEKTQFIIPDIYVENGDDGLIVSYNSECEPELVISQYYSELMRNSENEEVKVFLENRYRAAQNLITGLERRRNTLKKCVDIIADYQKDFFYIGPRQLRPMLLKDVAAAIGMHESTVSRAIKDKYLQCRFGTFPLNSFFSRTVFAGSMPDGIVRNDLSSQRIKNLIKEMIEKEAPGSPLSDQQLCDKLNRINIPISRRTVTKYREQLGIPTKSIRLVSPDQAP